MDQLQKFADSGFRDDAFIKKVGNIVKVGCHEP